MFNTNVAKKVALGKDTAQVILCHVFSLVTK